MKREEVARDALVRTKGFIADLEPRARSRFFVVGELLFVEGGEWRVGLADWRTMERGRARRDGADGSGWSDGMDD